MIVVSTEYLPSTNQTRSRHDNQTWVDLYLFNDNVSTADVICLRMRWENGHVQQIGNDSEGDGRGIFQEAIRLFVW